MEVDEEEEEAGDGARRRTRSSRSRRRRQSRTRSRRIGWRRSRKWEEVVEEGVTRNSVENVSSWRVVWFCQMF